MKVILLKDVPTLGRAGEIRDVKEGYAHHFLVPRGLAAPATAANLQHLQASRKATERREARLAEQTAELKARLEVLVVEVPARAGEGGRLFGSVTAQDVADAIARKGIEISKRQIDLSEPIKTTGFYKIPIHIHPQVSAMVEVNVVSTG
jgi:large subunit ribosomal protein L9